MDVLFVGDSCMALVEKPDQSTAAGRRVRHVGDYVATQQQGLINGHCGGVQSELLWGKGLKEINDEIERQLLRRKSRRLTNPVLIVVGWAGNDVWGSRGFVGNRWIDKASGSWDVNQQRAGAELQRERADARDSVTLPSGRKWPAVQPLYPLSMSPI